MSTHKKAYLLTFCKDFWAKAIGKNSNTILENASLVPRPLLPSFYMYLAANTIWIQSNVKDQCMPYSSCSLGQPNRRTTASYLQSKGVYCPGPRFILELRPFLKETYGEEVPDCHICKDPVIMVS